MPSAATNPHSGGQGRVSSLHQRQELPDRLAYRVVEVDVWNLAGGELTCHELRKRLGEFGRQSLAPRPVQSVNADGIGLRFRGPAEVASPGATVPHRKPSTATEID